MVHRLEKPARQERQHENTTPGDNSLVSFALHDSRSDVQRLDEFIIEEISIAVGINCV